MSCCFVEHATVSRSELSDPFLCNPEPTNACTCLHAVSPLLAPTHVCAGVCGTASQTWPPLRPDNLGVVGSAAGG
jgi:hypothetical protein